MLNGPFGVLPRRRARVLGCLHVAGIAGEAAITALKNALRQL
jgi:hypothetical protein